MTVFENCVVGQIKHINTTVSIIALCCLSLQISSWSNINLGFMYLRNITCCNLSHCSVITLNFSKMVCSDQKIPASGAIVSTMKRRKTSKNYKLNVVMCVFVFKKLVPKKGMGSNIEWTRNVQELNFGIDWLPLYLCWRLLAISVSGSKVSPGQALESLWKSWNDGFWTLRP